MNFTEDQQKVIDLRDRNILVSAAAGSGKTAVLVERIIKKICDVDHPVDIDKMLIVTFTSASAAEMRERISKAVNARLESEPYNEHLQRQATLIHNAQITTIDSFCLFLVKNHFNSIDLDPGFRVADEAEGKLLRSDSMQELLEEEYAKADEKFIKFVESYATSGSEKALEEAIIRLYNFAISYPWPEEWLAERAKDYQVETKEELYQLPWFKEGIKKLKDSLRGCLDRLNTAMKIANEPTGPMIYIENLTADIEVVKKAMEETNYEKIHDILQTPFTTLSRKKAPDVDPELREIVKEMRDDTKKKIQGLVEQFFPFSIDRTIQDMKICSDIVAELSRLSLRYKEIFDAKKRDKNIVDFSDMEHFALRILLDKDPENEGKYKPSEVAESYQQHFKEVMIDEYQDSNLVQELLLSSVSGEDINVFNRFMVGDVKQSIYKFRLARPEIFMEKFDTYTHEESNRQRIDLSKNFRSRVEVTESVNLICSQIMIKEVGGVTYDDNAELKLGADYSKCNDDRYAAELMIATTTEDEEKIDAKEREASMIAKRIKELVGKYEVRDKSGVMRTALYKDIVILLRSTVGWEEALREVFAKEGIPLHMISRSGYFQTSEVQNLINFLRILDNPLQDVALFGVLKSRLFGFTEEEIATIRSLTQYRKGKLYQFMKAYQSGEIKAILEKEEAEKITAIEELSYVYDEALQKKIGQCIDKIEQFRHLVPYTPIRELIRKILFETGYEEYICAMPDGEQRKANVEFLIEQAGSFEQTSFYGLFHFIRYLEQIKEQEVDFGEVNILDENADVVRMMTIHKSKGLEFPICFVAGLSKQFNQMDSRKNILLDVDWGIGTDFIDPVERIKRKTLRKNMIKQKMETDSRGEDLRVLYVALTRAKEKLILTAFDSKLEKTLQSLRGVMELKTRELPEWIILEQNNYEKLILASLMRHDVMNAILDGESFSSVGTYGESLDTGAYKEKFSKVPMIVTLWDGSEKLEEAIKEEVKEIMMREELQNANLQADIKIEEILQDKFNFQYPHENLRGLMTKTTVSELKKDAYLEQNDGADQLVKTIEKEPYIPRFAREDETVQGTTRGTAYHKVCELLDWKHLPENASQIEAYMVEKIKDGYIPEEYKNLIWIPNIETLVKSDLAKRMSKAAENKRLFLEQPFVIGIKANQLREEFPEEETVLIQGVIDAFFEEDDGLVLVDYKTDRVEEESELIKRYKTQLDYYEEALIQLLGKPVKQKIIYSFALKKEVELE